MLSMKPQTFQLPDIVKQCENLSLSEREELTLLRRYETLFDGTLGGL
jgi:hypothetical protein